MLSLLASQYFHFLGSTHYSFMDILIFFCLE